MAIIKLDQRKSNMKMVKRSYLFINFLKRENVELNRQINKDNFRTLGIYKLYEDQHTHNLNLIKVLKQTIEELLELEAEKIVTKERVN